MNKKVLASSIALAFLLVVIGSAFVGSPANRVAQKAGAAADPLRYLPASDGLALIDVRRMLNETMPRILAGDPAKLAQANAEIEKFKTRTGINPRAFNSVVVGTRYTYPTAGVTKLETVAIAHGTFDVKSLSSAAKTAAKGKYREELYRGATIMIVPVNDRIKLLGVWDVDFNELAICALDSNSLAIGSVPNVRAAITTGLRGSRANGELIALANRDPHAVLGFGANLSRELMTNLNVGNDTLAKDVGAIRQVYGSVGSTESDVSLLLVARTDSAASANNLNDTVTGLKQLGGLFIGRMAPAKKVLAQSALDNLKITTRGNEVEIKTQVAATNLAAVIK